MSTRAPWVGRAVVYRCYAAEGSLLYIGSSRQLEQRLTTHQGTSFWRCYVARVRIQLAPDELSARRMEAAAIREENPRFNLLHRRPRSEWTEQDFRDVIRVMRTRQVTAATGKRIANLQRELSNRLEGLA
jgi:excinuclease UvrABC nuclease subunit